MPIADNDHGTTPASGNGLPSVPPLEIAPGAMARLYGLPDAIARRWHQRGGHGRVTLVGAGPGDPELLTVKAIRAIQSADAILFDALVSDEILAFARARARRILVGKRGYRRSCRQEDIIETMLSLARAGRHVVRLKSGDPMIFGRGGEEVEACRTAGIPVEVVPGITAGLALSASLGLSLTHRDAARSVRFVTGHSRQGVLPDDLDWAGLADPKTTLIVYMGAAQAGEIATRLVAHGLAPSTPAVVAAGIGQADGTTWAGRLDRLIDGVATAENGAPVLVGIGTVFADALHIAGSRTDVFGSMRNGRSDVRPA